jgi:outer membrane immunogenic protein
MKARRVALLAFTLTSIAALAPANAMDPYSARELFGDVPYKSRPVVGTWAGFYAGVNGGGAGADESDKFAFGGTGFGGISPSGGFGGGQIGYNYQGFRLSNWVLGVEADIQGAAVDDKATDAAHNVFKSSLDYFGTVRGRFGYAAGPSLIYATGGFAYGGIQNEVSGIKFNGIATGFTVGGGVEFMFSPAWSAKFEYQFIDLGRNDPAFAGTSICSAVKCEEDAFHTIRVGLNYHTRPAYEPLKYEPLK